MTGEEMEKAIAFILEHQAQLTINQQRHEEVMRMHEEAMRGHEETMRRIEAAQALTAQQVSHLSTVMTGLAEAQARTDAVVAETNERLNALIDTVERIVGGRRDGEA